MQHHHKLKTETDRKKNYAFVSTIGVSECVYGDINALLKIIQHLLETMKSMNAQHNVHCEFFRIDFRRPTQDESLLYPDGYLQLKIKWGDQDEFNKAKANNDGYA